MDTTQKKVVQEVVSTARTKQSLCILFSSNSLFAERSFLACNLAVELARRGFSVGLIETTSTLPNAFFLLGALFPESTELESVSSLPEKSPPLSPPLPVPEPLKLNDISIGDGKKIKAVFCDRDFDSADFLSILNGLKRESHFIIINGPDDILELKKAVSFMNPFCIVPVAVNSEELLKSYSLIKQISEDVAYQEIGLLIVAKRLYHKAEAAFNIIAEMTYKFLSANICYMGVIPMRADFCQSILSLVPFPLEEKNSPLSQSIKKLADNVTKQYIYIKETSDGEAKL
jgi:hypothetical protein